ncbi:hypothetical protein EYB53_009415 [Candidatus Chloroploca sp. M-50]|uniref:Phytase-like domain-containing protein n=1 Tax=Candidatus Chloroploca mongolica TaxID=2528176 RepID=A0ABS4D8Z2_9CHLR|nr:hypothetical protein [Candidatus Chloroploca mongolica]MBP1465921.1 hypothetical protein [Candidatus Chloroploca mongolica]
MIVVLVTRLPASQPTPVTPIATDGCRGLPAFAPAFAAEAGGTLALATDRTEQGLVLLTDSTVYQHPTWDDAGYLGAMAYDHMGNVYVAPTPRISLQDNPLAGVTTLWRVDSATGIMSPFVTLEGEAGERNPFGILGLTYACGLDRLFAGTVIGSTPGEERGGIVAIDRDGQQTSLVTGLDVMGVLVVTTPDGYDLYAGLARSPDLIALPLDANGTPSGPLRPLLDLTTAGATAGERARKMRLVGDELIVDLVPFNFSLQSSATGNPQARQATWGWDADLGAWVVRASAR